jgi:hypothetical protein
LSSSYIRVLDRGAVYNTASGQVVALPNNSTTDIFKDSTRNILYVATYGGGVWEYNLTTRVGKVYNTAGGVLGGNQLPENNVLSITKDVTNNILYVGTETKGVWVYYINSNYGRTFDNMDVFVGDNIPSNQINAISITSNTAYNIALGTSAGVWVGTVANVALNNGKLYNAAGGVGGGSNIPDDNALGLFCDIASTALYTAVGNTGGIWILNTTTNIGSIIDSTTIVVGDSLPLSDVYNIQKDLTNGFLYASTKFGLWRYKISTNTGKIFNTAGGATNGSQVPSNQISNSFVDEVNGIVYAGTDSGLWEYNTLTDTGKVYNTTSGAAHGSQLPNNVINGIFKDTTRNVVYAATSAGVWQYIYISNIIYDGTQTRTVTYQQFTTDVLNEPIMIDHIRLMCSDASQFNKPIKLYYTTPNGKVESKYYSTLINRMATDGDQTVLDINLPKPIAFGSENYFALDILPSTTIFFSVFYRQVNKWELLNNIISFRDNQFDSENSKTL